MGDVPQTLREALDRLAGHEAVADLRVSRLFETAPVGSRAGSRFKNLAATLSTTLQPVELLDLCQELEESAGRARPHRWAPRSLDADVIDVEETPVQIARLTVPHPAAWYRQFVLVPLQDVAPDWTLSVHGTVRELVTRWSQPALRVSLVRWASRNVQRLEEAVRSDDALAARIMLEHARGDAEIGFEVVEHSTDPVSAVPFRVRLGRGGDVVQEALDVLAAVTDRPVPVTEGPFFAPEH